MSVHDPNDDDIDDIHHALGRPKKYSAGDVTFRNHFVVSDTSEYSARFAVLGLWTKKGLMNDGRDAVWCVNDKGKTALAEWLKAPRRETEHEIEPDPNWNTQGHRRQQDIP